jgi:hypothetical protein
MIAVEKVFRFEPVWQLMTKNLRHDAGAVLGSVFKLFDNRNIFHDQNSSTDPSTAPAS